MQAVLELMAAAGALLKEEPYGHKVGVVGRRGWGGAEWREAAGSGVGGLSAGPGLSWTGTGTSRTARKATSI